MRHRKISDTHHEIHEKEILCTVLKAAPGRPSILFASVPEAYIGLRTVRQRRQVLLSKQAKVEFLVQIIHVNLQRLLTAILQWICESFNGEWIGYKNSHADKY